MIGVSLTTPDKIRDLQNKLYRKAKNEPGYRFHQLYDKVYREDILQHAYRLAKANDGAPGVDGESFEDIESKGREEWLTGLRKDLHDKTYRAQPVKRKKIPKPDGGERLLGIPTIRDRVAQTAAKLILEAIWEAELEPNAYGYRPGKSAQGAIEEVNELLHQGYTNIVDADLSKYFDTIPHSELMKCVARRIVDRQMLHLIKMWLEAPVEERDEKTGKSRWTGGKGNDRGTPQGGVISPLLANLYMNRMLKGWKQTGRTAQFRAHIVNYADDFVIACRGNAAAVLEWTRGAVERMGLTLNEKKTSIRNARKERFEFLGYSFGPHYSRKTGREHMGASPSLESESRIKQDVSKLLDRRTVEPWEKIRDQLNQKLKGWKNYFNFGSTSRVYHNVDEHVYDRVRNFLRRRHKVSSQGTRQFPSSRVYGELGVVRLYKPYRPRS